MGMGLARGSDFSVTLTLEDLTKNMKLPPAPPKLSAGWKEPQSMDEIKMRQNKLGELCWAAAVSRPGISARLASISSRIN